MSNSQLVGLLLTLVIAQSAMLKWYMDAKFAAMDARFTAIDNQLKFLTEHMVSHAERIAALEAKSK